MKKELGIGLYGGTFDPLHNGHIRAVAKIKQLPYIDDLHIHVNYEPKYKTPLFPFFERLMFVNHSLSSYADIIQEQFDFTYQVLKYMRKIYGKKTPIYFFVGKEWDLSTFKNADYVIKNCHRINIEPNEIKIRSTDIRAMILKKEPLDGLVPDCVKSFVERKMYNEY